MRFFQSESHSKPDDTNDDDTVRAEPVPAPRASDENDTDRGPDAADSPHISTGFDDADADRDGVNDAEPRPDEDDSAARTGEPVDADVVPDEPVVVEPVPQETAFGAATVGGAVAASEQAAHREDDDTTAVGTASVPDSPEELDEDGKPLRAETAEGFGPAGTDSDTGSDTADTTGTETDATSADSDTVVADPDAVVTDSDTTGVDSDSADADADSTEAEEDKPLRAEDEGETVEAGQSAGGETVEGFGPAHRADDDGSATEGFGTAEGTEGFGSADDLDDSATVVDTSGTPEDTEGFGTPEDTDGSTTVVDTSDAAEDSTDADVAAPVDEDKPLRAEDIEDDDSAEGEPVTTHVDETTALGVAAGAAAGAAAAGAATKDRDRDGHPDSERVAVDGEPLTPTTTAAVPIEPVPAPAGEAEAPATTDEPVELLPGDVPEQPALAAFFREETATDFRDRWREVQLRFVDDPAQAASDAGTLIDEVVTALNAAVTEQREALGGTTSGGDTEQLRVLVRRQRDFLDRILGL
ncbi:hypothetical protein [Catenuloplanes japonicus]|uniref:hypothetical protein n=1 Tax=Catenuloplanes japonicus TaxID=33876 RepID=UPI000525B89F|nr:hypothetical protein [Catenuloplanes japonicus]